MHSGLVAKHAIFCFTQKEKHEFIHLYIKRHLTLLCYHYFHNEKQRKRRKKEKRWSLFSPVVEQLLVCIHTTVHHMLQFTDQLELLAICSTDGISVCVETNVSEHCFSDLQVKWHLGKTPRLKLGQTRATLGLKKDWRSPTWLIVIYRKKDERKRERKIQTWFQFYHQFHWLIILACFHLWSDNIQYVFSEEGQPSNVLILKHVRITLCLGKCV